MEAAIIKTSIPKGSTSSCKASLLQRGRLPYSAASPIQAQSQSQLGAVAVALAVAVLRGTANSTLCPEQDALSVDLASSFQKNF